MIVAMLNSSNITNQTTLRIELIKWTFVISFCVTILILDCVSISLLATTKHLKKSRFFILVLFLSISDAIQMVECIWLLIIKTMNETLSVIYQCMVLKHLISGTVLYSLLEVLFICIERLNGTFTTPNKMLKSVSCKVYSAVGIVVTHLYVMILCGFELYYGPKPCSASYTVQERFMLYNDIPVLALVLSVVTCYLIVIIRLIRHKIYLKQHNSELQIQSTNLSESKMRRGIATLGLIIIVSVASFTPRMIIGVHIHYTGSSFEDYNYSVSNSVGNNLLLLNPLLDPIIYVLTIKEFRDRFKCRWLEANRIHPIN